MSFFDKKEDVIKIELTQFGKFLLSQGKWKPVYYSFFDEDILYDGAYGGVIEEQNSIVPRIKEAPRLKPQYNFSSADTGSRSPKNVVTQQGKKSYKQNIEDRLYMKSAPLGNADLLSEYMPAFQISFLNGELTGSLEYVRYRNQPLTIPKLTSYINYKITVDSELLSSSLTTEQSLINKVDSLPGVDVQGDYLVLEIIENNTPFTKENFDIEIFDFDNSGSMRQLYFADNIAQTLNMDYADYYLDIKIDDEVDDELLCANKKTTNIFIDNENCALPPKQDNKIIDETEEIDKPC